MKDKTNSDSLKVVNYHLKFSEWRNRSYWAKADQAAMLHQVMNHRPHQQEY